MKIFSNKVITINTLNKKQRSHKIPDIHKICPMHRYRGMIIHGPIVFIYSRVVVTYDSV